MTHTVLAATDFSDPARHALARAAQLASTRPGTTLTLAHVVSASMLARLGSLMADEGASIEARLRTQATAALDELASRLGSQYGCPVTTRLREGLAIDAIPALADELAADLLVLGARGKHFAQELLLGSTVERVLRKTRRPLLAVKARPRDAYRRVLVPVDFSPHSEAAARTALAWLPRAELVLLNVFGVEMESTLRFAGIAEAQINAYRERARDGAHEAMERLVGRLDVPPSRLTRRIVHGAPTLAILEQEASLDIDLVVMGKHGQSPMEELLLGSVTKHVLAYARNDVMVVTQTG